MQELHPRLGESLRVGRQVLRLVALSAVVEDDAIAPGAVADRLGGQDRPPEGQ